MGRNKEQKVFERSSPSEMSFDPKFYRGLHSVHHEMFPGISVKKDRYLGEVVRVEVFMSTFNHNIILPSLFDILIEIPVFII
jgi:hypothetical protein